MEEKHVERLEEIFRRLERLEEVVYSLLHGGNGFPQQQKALGAQPPSAAAPSQTSSHGQTRQPHPTPTIENMKT